MILDIEETFTVGEDTYFSSDSPVNSYSVVFEDDLNTGYFYALDTKDDIEILDALHIYNVANVIDKDKLCTIKIAWTEDGLKASLLINNYCHAIFDFKNEAGYCRNGFPSSNGKWQQNTTRSLSDGLINELLQA